MTPADNQRDDELDEDLEAFEEELPEEDDLDAYGDDDAYAEDDWDDSADDELAANPAGAPGAQKKKSSMSNNLIIAGAVIVGLCVMAYQVVSKAPQSVQQFQSALGMKGSTDGPVFGNNTVETADEAETPKEIPEGFLNTQQQLPGYEEKPATPDVQDAPPQPSPIAATENETSLTPMPSDMPGASTEPLKVEGKVNAETTDMVPRAPDELPDNPALEASAEVNKPELPADTAAVSAPAPSKAEDILKAAIENRAEKQAEVAAEPSVPSDKPGVSAEIESPESDPVQTPKSDTQPAETPSAAPVVAAAQETSKAEDERIKALTDRLDQLEAQLADKDKKIEITTSELEAVKQKLASTESVAVNTSATPVPAVQANEDKVTPQKTSAPKAKKKKSAAVSGKWVLRAAQPGRAWISKPGERDMKALQVGDTVTGLGRVTAITYDGQRWSVVGTQGRVNQ
jgi:hypothetical protein